ncbi:ABC transporter permease [Enhygromyxa salina]|uniref:Outer membrane-specific lipoprotein transporter subunit LolC n=1 Tax=Enhygromyxa salina TaxID=215803 RepID=A0A2S9YYJ3_9BACT|nr:FtsX-like permease family protein [Enhygromyxa salina]PRQ10147.1 outer membrane-specific lipoprotein transporter subunit LolC [Enhygromyxa salina]
MDDLKLAWRNVWRNTRRSVVTMAATGLALFVMIAYTGIITGYLKGLEANILNLEVGDIQVFANEYREKPSLYTTIADPAKLTADLEGAGYQVSSRLLASGLGASEENSSGVQMIGLDVVADADVSTISQQTRAGTWLEPDDEGVVIGWRLAETLSLDVGGELVVLSQGADGSMANDVYPIRGVLKGISDGVDRAGVFMTEAEFRELMVLPEGVHQMIVRKPPGTELEAATATAQGFGPDGVEISSWKTIKPTLASMLESSEVSMGIMAVIIYIAVGILILNAMLMAVFERIRELGVLKAIGFTPLKVLKLIFLETAVQTAVAMAAGVLVAIPVNYYLVHTGINMGNMSVMGMAWDPIWRSSITLETYTGPMISMVIIVALAVLYPALRAAYIQPLDAIRD